MFRYLILMLLALAACQTPVPTPVIGEWNELLTQPEAWQVNDGLEVEWSHNQASLQGERYWMHYPVPFSHFRLEGAWKSDSGASLSLAFRIQDSNPEVAYQLSLHRDPHRQSPAGSIRLLARGLWLDTLARGNWQNFALEAIGDHLRVFLDSQLVAEVHDQNFHSGSLALQAPRDGSTAHFRNLRIMPLPAPVDSVPTLESRLRPDDPTELRSPFNGQAWTGWEKMGAASWEIEEGGIIHGTAGETSGYLCTEDLHQDFYLRLKFKIAYEENSGVFIQHDPQASEVNLQTGLECNIYDHNGLAHPFSTGSLVLQARARGKMVDYEAWNEMEIFALGDHICLYVNGEKASEKHVDPAWVRSGKICLQAGTRVFSDNGPSHVSFKDMLLKEYDVQ